MNKIFFSAWLTGSLMCSLPGHAQNYLPRLNDKRLAVQSPAPVKAYAFEPSEVSLLESPFKTAMKADEAYLLSINPDRLLAGFRINAGLRPKDKLYGGWEAEGLAGHSLGHYLSALSMQYASTKNPLLLARVNDIVSELAECQRARKTGYIGAIPKEDQFWAEVANGDIRTGGFDLNGAWAPWYTVHKIMAGLLDAYLYGGNQQALVCDMAFSDWTGETLKNLNDAQLQKMLICEYGGIAETMVNLYAITGRKKYLDLSYKFYDRRILDPLSQQQDILPGKHSNTQIPKVIASARRYMLNGDLKDKAIADFFWEVMTRHHSYVTGGNSNYEYLSEPDQLNDKLTDHTTETCNTYNMLKLTAHLFTLNPEAAYFDYYEKGLYNHILASQHHETGMMCYFVPLRMGGKKEYSDPFNSFTCCVGTGMENHVKYNQGIYFKGDDGSLYVNLFIPSVLNWKDKGLQITQETAIPYAEQTSLRISTRKASKFTIRLRKPKWAGPVTLLINGKPASSIPEAAGYYLLSRTWKNGDKITYTVPEHLYTEAMPDNPGRKAIFYGPVLLAGDLGMKEPDPVDGIPVLVSPASDPAAWLKLTDPKTLRFQTTGVAKPDDISLLPFNQTKDEHYSVYWDVFNPDQWLTQQKVYEERRRQQKELEDQTSDLFRFGEMQPERDHNLIAVNAHSGEDHGKKWRTARENGSLQFDMRIDPELPNVLIATYWGMDNRGRKFDVLVNGVTLATEDLNQYKESRFYHISYALPPEMTKGKKKVSVKLVPKEKNEAGPIYELRAVRGK